MKRNVKLIITTLSLAQLYACGGGGDNKKEVKDPVLLPPVQTISISGKVIDGYVSGATVFLDLNFNGNLDTEEPSTISTDKGDYSFELTEAEHKCASYVPVIVNVPVGAIDEDSGEVTEAYQMVLPPQFELITDDTLLNISPITTVIWDAIENELKSESDQLSCSILLENNSKREKLTQTLSAAISAVVLHYNISSEQLFKDFIAENNDEVKAKALNIVQGLKKSFAETVKLKSEYPEALWLSVNYHMFDSRDADDLYPNAWYRESYIALNEYSTVFHLSKVSDDLNATIRTIIHGERSNINIDNQSIYQSFEFESRKGDDSSYSCDIKEGINFTSDDVEFELTNLVSQTANIYEDCLIDDFNSAVTKRYSFINYKEVEINYSAQFSFTRTDKLFPDLNEWIDLIDNYQTLDIEMLISSLQSLPYNYDETGLGGADWWSKQKRYTENENSISIFKNSDGKQTKRTTFPDGTYTIECGTDGINWSECSD